MSPDSAPCASLVIQPPTQGKLPSSGLCLLGSSAPPSLAQRFPDEAGTQLQRGEMGPQIRRKSLILSSLSPLMVPAYRWGVVRGHCVISLAQPPQALAFPFNGPRRDRI